MFALGLLVGAGAAFVIAGFFVFFTYRLAQLHAGDEADS